MVCVSYCVKCFLLFIESSLEYWGGGLLLSLFIGSLGKITYQVCKASK